MPPTASAPAQPHYVPIPRSAAVETMAHIIAEGVREGGAQVDVKRVPENELEGARYQGRPIAETARKVHG